MPNDKLLSFSSIDSKNVQCNLWKWSKSEFICNDFSFKLNENQWKSSRCKKEKKNQHKYYKLIIFNESKVPVWNFSI